jgi:hypothetical protein
MGDIFVLTYISGQQKKNRRREVRTYRKPTFKPCHTTLNQCNETNLMAAGKRAVSAR